MEIHEKIELIVQKANKTLLLGDVKLVRHFLLCNEPELAVEFVCDLVTVHGV